MVEHSTNYMGYKSQKLCAESHGFMRSLLPLCQGLHPQLPDSPGAVFCKVEVLEA